MISIEDASATVFMKSVDNPPFHKELKSFTEKSPCQFLVVTNFKVCRRFLVTQSFQRGLERKITHSASLASERTSAISKRVLS